jgi:hypothetical protein
MPFCTLLGGAFTATDEVHDHRDDCEEDKQVDKKAGHMKTYEQAQPEQYEYHCENEEHLIPFFLDA